MKFDPPAARLQNLSQSQQVPAGRKSANPFAQLKSCEAKVKIGAIWLQSSPIQAEIQQLKAKVRQLLLTQPMTLPKFTPPIRDGVRQENRPNFEGKEMSNPFHPLDVSILSLDRQSGLLFQLPLSNSSMVFTATEIGTTLRCIGRLPKRLSGNVAFSLDPVNPESWNKKNGTSQLYQRKWYSHDTLQNIPLGYWMWRADWKLKQLAQGVVYDDISGQQRPLKLGVDVPHDFPDVTQGDAGCARLWIVCRKLLRMPWGRDSIVIHPDVQMGVEVRAQKFNKLTGKYEDTKDAPHSSASKIAEYLSRHYDRVAHFVPELDHCKRMAVLLDVAHWLLDGPLDFTKLMDQHISTDLVPQDFPAEQVPALFTKHEKGLEEEAKVKKMDQELSIKKAQFQKSCAEKEQHIQSLLVAAEKQMKRVEAAKKELDKYSSESVEACNLEVQKYNSLVEEHKSYVKSYNSAIDTGNGKLKAMVSERNSAAAACNAVRSSLIFMGGVDLAPVDVPVKPVPCEAQPIQEHFQQWGKGLWGDHKTSNILRSFQSGRSSDSKVSLLQEVVEERKASLSVFPLTAPAAWMPRALKDLATFSDRQRCRD